MPSDLIIKTADTIKITIPPPTVVPSLQAPVMLIGSAKATSLQLAPVCLEGDELPKMLLSPQPYTAPPFLTPGTGKVTVRLAANNKTKVTKEGGKAILLKGASFTAEFQVLSPAIDPTTGTPDPQMKKTGTAQFATMNSFVKAE